MSRKTIDLSSRINQSVERGHAADFPVSLRPIMYQGPDESTQRIPNRVAVVREDCGEAISVVSDRYAFVPHQRLLDVMLQACRSVDVGPVPRGIYVDRRGGRMRAIFKFPALAQNLNANDEICPCVKIINTYDGTSRISVSIGAFRFVCTNLAVGGGGVFAGGFMAIHAGEIPVEEVGEQLVQFLAGFERIVETYRAWTAMPIEMDRLNRSLEKIPSFHQQNIRQRLLPAASVFAAYNKATAYATHETRSAAVAFGLLDKINHGFQEHFPVLQPSL